MILSYLELVELLDNGVLTRGDYDLINSASIDIRLGEHLLIEHGFIELKNEADGSVVQVPSLHRISLKDREEMRFKTHSLIKDGPFILYPGEFILAQSHEMFHLPNNVSAEYKLKSSMARIGLEHLNAGWCDAGWHGSFLTLELKNMTRNHEIVLHHMDKIGQMVFMKHTPVPADKSYAVRGRYNNDKTVSGAKLDPIKTIVFGEETEDVEAELYAKEHPVLVEFHPNTGKSIMVIGEEEVE